MLRFRATKGTPPYIYDVLDATDTVINTVTSSSEEVAINIIPHSDLKFRVTDNSGSVVTKSFDLTTMVLSRKYFSGQRVEYAPSGADMQTNYDAGFRCMGVTFETTDNVSIHTTPYASSQEAWDALGNPFDHTTPIVGEPLCPMDATVRKAYELNMPLIMNIRTTIRQQYLIGEPEGNGWSYNKTDIAMRPDGVTGINALSGRDVNGDLIHPVTFVVGSPATTSFKLFCSLLLQKVVNRYKAALNSGIIIGMGLSYTDASEAEFPFHYHTPGNSSDNEIRSMGDFHSQMVSGFKTQFPQYSSSSNNDIANATGNLERDWWWYNSDVLRKCSWEAIDYTISNTAGLNRTKWYMHSVGAYSDILGKWRKTYNATEFFKHPAIFVAKTNADPVGSDFELDLVASLAIKCSGIGFYEVTPPGDSSTEENKWKIVEGTNKAMQRNISVVFPVHNWGRLNEIKSLTNVLSKTTNSEKGDIKIEGGIKKIVSMEYPLSQIIQDGSNATANAQRSALITNSGTTNAFIEIKDNVKP